MRVEIIKPDGDLKREEWIFSLSVSHSSPCIYFDHFSFQTKESLRHKNWIKQTHWDRLDRRYNNIEAPEIPDEIKKDMFERYRAFILTLPIIS